MMFHEYKALLSCLGLDLLAAPTFGFEPAMPLQSSNNLERLFEEYEQREGWFRSFLTGQYQRKTDEQPLIIWAEASRMGCDQYVYRQDTSGHFVNANKSPGYFANVKEMQGRFNSTLIVDFFHPFGLNHSKESRQFINLCYKNNSSYYDTYLSSYLGAVLKTARDHQSIARFSNVIVAPKDTAKSIAEFLRNQGVNGPIKCYKIDHRGWASPEYCTLP